MNPTRRQLVTLLSSSVATLWAGVGLAGPRTRQRRRIRRRVRRKVRRRHRRRVTWRVVNGRRALVVPVGVAVGWELAVASERAGAPDEIVVVKEVRTIQVDNKPVEVAVVTQPDGKDREIDIVREDTKENAKPLEGTILTAGDTTTPHEEAEIDVEEDVEE